MCKLAKTDVFAKIKRRFYPTHLLNSNVCWFIVKEKMRHLMSNPIQTSFVTVLNATYCLGVALIKIAI